jgi:hypothetical protein
VIARVPPRRRLAYLVVMLAWIGFILYPDPRVFFSSAKRLVTPPVDPTAVTELARTLPDDAAAIEAFSQQHVRYDNPWRLYGVPWYFPTVDDVLRDQAGDCQAEAILTASILEAKGLPYTLRYAFDHVWVDYEGKVAAGLEDPARSFMADEGEGWFAKLPEKLPWRDIVRERVEFHWYPMPAEQKGALLAGLLVLLFVGEGLLGSLARWFGRSFSVPAPSLDD